MSNSGEILQDIEKTTKIKIIEYQISPIRDSHINYKKKKDSAFFIKLNMPLLINMFKAETQGFKELRKLSHLRIPQVICSV